MDREAGPFPVVKSNQFRNVSRALNSAAAIAEPGQQ